jgi:hypothetical protein
MLFTSAPEARLSPGCSNSAGTDDSVEPLTVLRQIGARCECRCFGGRWQANLLRSKGPGLNTTGHATVGAAVAQLVAELLVGAPS